MITLLAYISAIKSVTRKVSDCHLFPAASAKGGSVYVASSNDTSVSNTLTGRFDVREVHDVFIWRGGVDRSRVDRSRFDTEAVRAICKLKAGEA